MKDVILSLLFYIAICFGILLAFALPILLISSIINQISYGDWTCSFKECVVIKGDKE